jgi:hypothetical protein
MPSTSHNISNSWTEPDLADELDLEVRMCTEFSEMPGLRLTLAQASRLFGAEQRLCSHVLTTLVERGELTTDGEVFAKPEFFHQFSGQPDSLVWSH